MPSTDKSGNWNDNKTSLWSLLAPEVDCDKNCKYPNLNSAISQESGSGTGISALSFNVTDISEGSWLFSGEYIPLPSEPMGTIFMAFTEDAQGNMAPEKSGKKVDRRKAKAASEWQKKVVKARAEG